MEEPTLSESVEVDIDESQVLLDFATNSDADQFREWWHDQGWSQFVAWATGTPVTEPTRLKNHVELRHYRRDKKLSLVAMQPLLGHDASITEISALERGLDSRPELVAAVEQLLASNR